MKHYQSILVLNSSFFITDCGFHCHRKCLRRLDKACVNSQKVTLLFFSSPALEKASCCLYLLGNLFSFTVIVSIWDHSFSTFAKFLEKPTFVTPLYAHVRVTY